MSAPYLARTATRGPDGAPLVVLGCSLGTSSLLWDAVGDALAAHYRVAVWDLPGHGATPPHRQAVTIGDLADGVATTFGEDFAYIGVSIGGAVGLELALRHPDRVRAVAALCSGARIGTPDAWHDRAAQVRAQGTASLVSASAQRWFAPGTIAREPDVTGRLLHSLRDADDQSYAHLCEALAIYDVRDKLPAIHTPVLACWGEHDAVVTEDDAARVAESIPGTRVARIDGAGHLPPVDAPHETTVLLARFLTESLKESSR